MNKIIAIVGMAGSGKSLAVEQLENLGYQKVYFGGITLDKLREEGKEINQENEKAMREGLRKEYGMGAYAILSLPKIKDFYKKGNVVIDGLYSWEELKILKEEFNDNLVLIAIITNKDLRYERLSKREIRALTKEEAIKRDVAELENMDKGGPIAYSDYFILNNKGKDDLIKELESIIKNN